MTVIHKIPHRTGTKKDSVCGELGYADGFRGVFRWERVTCKKCLKLKGVRSK
jgi:hypothetical protein